MSENNLPNEGTENEVTEEIVTEENISENVEENVEETTEETVEENVGFDEEPAEETEVQDLFAKKLANAEKKAAKFKTSATVAWILAAILICVDAWYAYTNLYNKYNHIGYYDVDGYTVGDVVASMGIDFDEFKEMYGLPKNMKKDTNLNAAQSLIKLSKMAELNGMDFADLKERYKFGDEITEESTYGEGLESMTIKDYIELSRAASSFEEFKTTYGIGDNITEDSKWGEVRKIYEKQLVAERKQEEEALKADKEAEKKAEEAEEKADDTEADDTSADSTATDGETESGNSDNAETAE